MIRQSIRDSYFTGRVVLGFHPAGPAGDARVGTRRLWALAALLRGHLMEKRWFEKRHFTPTAVRDRGCRPFSPEPILPSSDYA
jgi:hypothetical protein